LNQKKQKPIKNNIKQGMKKLILDLQEYLKCNFASRLTMWICFNLLQRSFHHLHGDGVCFKLSHLETQIFMHIYGQNAQI